MRKPPVRLRFAVLLAASLAAGACGRKSAPTPVSPDVVLQRARAAYDARKMGRAITLFQQFLSLAPGDPRVPEATYLLARARLVRGEEVTAASDFLRIITDFPSDTLARASRMGLCDAYRRLSPAPALDQEYTRAAIRDCGSYAELYPGTPEAAQAQAAVAEMQAKLASKAYQNGIFYFRRKAYDAAVIYFTQAVDDYPRTPVAPAALLKLVQSYAAMGYAEERDTAKQRLQREYPRSAEARSLAG